jgi:hypothetical protein
VEQSTPAQPSPTPLATESVQLPAMFEARNPALGAQKSQWIVAGVAVVALISWLAFGGSDRATSRQAATESAGKPTQPTAAEPSSAKDSAELRPQLPDEPAQATQDAPLEHSSKLRAASRRRWTTRLQSSSESIGARFDRDPDALPEVQVAPYQALPSTAARSVGADETPLPMRRSRPHRQPRCPPPLAATRPRHRAPSKPRTRARCPLPHRQSRSTQLRAAVLASQRTRPKARGRAARSTRQTCIWTTSGRRSSAALHHRAGRFELWLPVRRFAERAA